MSPAELSIRGAQFQDHRQLFAQNRDPGTSDLDLLVVLSRRSAPRRNSSSSSILDKVRLALRDGLPSTDIRTSEQCIKVSSVMGCVLLM